MQDEYERGLHHGWDAANYAGAYGEEEPPEQEARRRAGEYASVTPAFDVDTYVAGFMMGHVRHVGGQWQDGTARDEDDQSRSGT